MKYFKWGIGSLLVISGLVALLEGKPLAGCIVAMICGFILLPFVSDRFSLPNWVFFLFGFVGIMGYGMTQPQENPNTVTQTATVADSLEQVRQRASKMEMDISSAHLRAQRSIKNMLKDPDSFEEIDHRSGFVGSNGVYVSSLVTYRSKNSFGGFAVGKVLVNFDEEMKPIEAVSVE